MVRLEEIKAVGKEDAQDALIHFFQMKPQKSVSEEWKKKESSKQKDYMKKFDYELIIVLTLVAIFVLGICLDNMLLFILGFIGLIVSTGDLIKKKLENSDSDEDVD